MSGVAVSNTIQEQLAVRKFLSVYYDGAKFSPDHFPTHADFEVLAGDSGLADTFLNYGDQDPLTIVRNQLSNPIFVQTWQPGNSIKLDFRYDHNSLVIIVMIFTQSYIKLEIIYGPFGIPISVTPAPQIEYEYVETTIIAYDDTSPKFFDMPELGEVKSTEEYRASCPGQFPTVKTTLEEILS